MCLSRSCSASVKVDKVFTLTRAGGEPLGMSVKEAEAVSRDMYYRLFHNSNITGSSRQPFTVAASIQTGNRDQISDSSSCQAGEAPTYP